MKDFIDCLFESNESTCFTLLPKGTSVVAVSSADPKVHCYFSINALHATKDLGPTESWHSSHRPRRSDDNVVSYRNILIEMDKLSLDEQKAHISSIALPYSTAVFSGSKSVHFIISLTTPLPDRSAYNSLVRRVYRAVGKNFVDHACKNPSRLSRLPGHFRTDKGNVQELMEVRGRVENSALEAWLLSQGIKPEVEWEEVVVHRVPRDFSSLKPATKNFIMMGASVQKGEWNPGLFKASADLCRNGWSLEEAFQKLSLITGTLDKNDEKTINSAYRNELSKEKSNDKTN